MFKNFYFLLFAFMVSTFLAQTPIQVGSGSYASFPLSEELQFDWEGTTYYNDYDFIYNDPIYVSEGETRPIPTNDWWTRILIDKYGGLLFAYPLVMEPTSDGLKIQYPIGFNSSGSDLERGNGLLIKGGNFTPDKAIAKYWSDWSVLMGMPDADTDANMDVTMTHGIPFTHIEANKFIPIITTNGGAAYFNADGSALSFPVAAGSEFIISSEGRLFGIHLGDNATANLTGQQHITVDLGQTYSLTSINMIWETAYASGYSIQVSDDNANWTTVHTISDGDGNTDTHNLSNNARYVRILLLEKGSIYEYSLFEIEVYNNSTNVALNKTAYASSQEGAFNPDLAIDGNSGTRWASAAGEQEQLMIDMNGEANHFVVSALTQFSDLTLYENYAHNKPTETKVDYSYDVNNGKINTTWNITTENLNGNASGNTIQGFLPHQYKKTTSTDVTYSDQSYVTTRGQLKFAFGKSFQFSYDFGGILPSFNKPFKNDDDTNPYKAEQLYKQISEFASRKNSYGGDTYWGGKDLVNIAKYALIAKELNHQSFDKLKELSKQSLIDWLTYTPGETEHYYARYDRWKALVGFNQSFGSAQFTDNHFHYGYLIYAASLYAMLDSEFVEDYGEMLQLVCKQYANWERDDTFLPYFRTFDPWIGHSYTGGTSSGNGNNQESTSEAMQSWIGMFLLGEMMGDNDMRDAGAFGYRSEASATLEYWFDWEEENLPEAYNHNMVGILWNGGYSYGTYFSASPVHIHGIQYLPINPGFKYLAENKTWANREYNDMMTESLAIDGHENEIDFGDDWAHVALGFRLLFDPEYVSDFLDTNIALGESNQDYIMDYDVSGITYYYTHAMQNLGDFSFNYRTNFPASSVFEENGVFTYATAYNSSDAEKTCNVYDNSGSIIATFSVPAKTLLPYPQLPEEGQEPENCYSLSSEVTASSGNNSAVAAVDGNMGTRWIAESTDPCVFDIDLGVKCAIEDIEILWETANASSYNVLVSNDKNDWNLVKSYTGLPSGERTDNIDTINDDYQYIRLSMTEASTVWAYSIYEINICGTLGEVNTELTWIGNSSSDWGTAANWDANCIPTKAHNITIPNGTTYNPIILSTTGVEANNITIDESSSLTIESGGSLVVKGTSTGNITYKVNVNDTNWHLLSSPVNGAIYDTSWIINNDIDDTSSSKTNIGIATYNNSTGNWAYETDGSSGIFTSGKGFSIKKDEINNTFVSFTGTLFNNDLTSRIYQNANNWNLVGNPYPAYIRVSDIIASNLTSLTETHQTVYVWDNNKIGGAGYSALIRSDNIIPGQGFFISAANSITDNFNIDISKLRHQTGNLVYKQTVPTIRLIVKDSKDIEYTEFNYRSNYTTGLDPSYDIGTFTGFSSTLSIYSHLVSNSKGTDFVRQALPLDYENLVIPIGVNARAGEELVFSSEALQLPTGINVILEDRVAKKYTILNEANATYKTILTNDLEDIGRFYLHTTQSTLSTQNYNVFEHLSIYKTNESTLRIVGLPQGNSKIQLFNVLGKEIINTSFMSDGIKDIVIPKLSDGIYIIQINTDTDKINKKIILN